MTGTLEPKGNSCGQPHRSLSRSAHALLAVGVAIWLFSCQNHPLRAYTMSYEIIHNTCPILRQILDQLTKDFVSPHRTTDKVNESILVELASTNIEVIEQFFRCFDFEEAAPPEQDTRTGVSRMLIARINIAKVKMPATPEEKEFVELTAYVVVIVKQRKNGSLLVSGDYRLI